MWYKMKVETQAGARLWRVYFYQDLFVAGITGPRIPKIHKTLNFGVNFFCYTFLLCIFTIVLTQGRLRIKIRSTVVLIKSKNWCNVVFIKMLVGTS